MKWIRRILWLVVSMLLLIIFLPLFARGIYPGDILTCLPDGWWFFLKRNIPQVTFNRGLVTTGVICSALALVLANWFMSNLCEQVQIRSQPGQPARKWRWRWSVGLYASIWLLFLIAFGAAGVWRHTTWFWNNNQPLYVERKNPYRELSFADDIISQILKDNHEDLQRTRKAILSGPNWRDQGNPLCEEYDVILYGDSRNQVAACLIIPRQLKSRAEGIFGFSDPQEEGLVKPLSQLPQLVSEMDGKYPIKVSL
jgi:hypothetical protein